jgi:hypothetical protein
MSRGLEIERYDGRDDARSIAVAREKPVKQREDIPRDPRQRSRALPSGEFCLPCGPDRETVWTRQRPYEIRGSESEVLVVAGTFRVVFDRDLADCDSSYSARLSLVASRLKPRATADGPPAESLKPKAESRTSSRSAEASSYDGPPAQSLKPKAQSRTSSRSAEASSYGGRTSGREPEAQSPEPDLQPLG